MPTSFFSPKGVAQSFETIMQQKGTKEFYIPLIDNYVKRFDLDKKILYTKNAKELNF